MYIIIIIIYFLKIINKRKSGKIGVWVDKMLLIFNN